MVIPSKYSIFADRGAGAIFTAFDDYYHRFKEITQKARSRFLQRDWTGTQADAVERLDLYGEGIGQIVEAIQRLFGDDLRDKRLWSEMKRRYTARISGRNDVELAETFFNSITRRIFSTVGVDPEIEYVASDFDSLPPGANGPAWKTYYPIGGLQALVRTILVDSPFRERFIDFEGDVRRIASEISSELTSEVDEVDFLHTVFYSLKWA
jgi:isocitrate dehydrogenase kinase/phosphatase